MNKDAGCLNDGKMAYDNASRVEPKRSRQWFMDGPDNELFQNKKQAVNAVSATNSFTGLLTSNMSPWGNASSFNLLSGQFGEWFDPETVSSEKVDVGRKIKEDLFVNDSSFGLSMSNALEDPRSGLSFGEISEVKVSQVKDVEDVMPAPVCHGYDSVDIHSLTADHEYKVNESSMGLAYNKGNDDVLSVGDGNNVFMSMGQLFNKGKENTAISPTFKDFSNGIAFGNCSDKTNSFIGQAYNRADDNPTSTSHTFTEVDASSASMSHAFSKCESRTLSMGPSYGKGESSTIISFGGHDDDDNTNPSESFLTNYDLLMSQVSAQRLEALNEKDTKSNAGAFISSIESASAVEVFRKKDDLKTSKKAPPNNFPSNVRSLLSTGMLDGVPVKYCAWSREKELRGVVKGTGYLCGCQSCNFSTVINAYEFERHAGCKTKHPNNHIYCENGKTIYGIVQELRTTPQHMLFDVIQTITGSPINQKSFRLWKESFLAATRELQRIYGNE